MVDYSLAGLYPCTRRDSQSLATLGIRLLNNFVMHSKLSNENSDAARMTPTVALKYKLPTQHG